MNFPKINIISIAAFVVLFAVNLLGQEVAITKADFEKIETASEKAAEGKTLRRTTVREELVNGVASAEKARRYIYESIPPDRTRYIYFTTFSDKTEKSETISIGPRSWTRTNDGPWTILEETNGIGGVAGVSTVIFESYKSKGKSKLSGVQVSEYEQVKKMASFYGDDPSAEEIITTSIWINKNGLRLKEIYEREITKTKTIYRRTEINDYNPKDLKIEAPMK